SQCERERYTHRAVEIARERERRERREKKGLDIRTKRRRGHPSTERGALRGRRREERGERSRGRRERRGEEREEEEERREDRGAGGEREIIKFKLLSFLFIYCRFIVLCPLT